MSNELQQYDHAVNGNGGALMAGEAPSMYAPATVGSQAVLASAILDKQVATARAFPRSVAKFTADCKALLSVDVETARRCEYAKPVGGGTVRGPSIRLAELVMSAWGNIEVSIQPPIVGDKSVTVIAAAWDLQTNVRREAMASTSIIGKSGQRFPGHLIETTCAATASKAVRNAILGVVPRAFVENLLVHARAVAESKEPPLAERRAKMIDFFAVSLKVKPEQVFAFCGVAGAEDLTPDHLADLRAVATAIKDGEAKPEEFFEPAAASGVEALKAKTKSKPDQKPTPALPGAAAKCKGCDKLFPADLLDGAGLCKPCAGEPADLGSLAGGGVPEAMK